MAVAADDHRRRHHAALVAAQGMTQTLMRRMALAQQKRAAQLTRLWLVGGWLGIILTLLLSLMPPLLDEGSGQTDKIVHLSGYAVLMFWWAQLITRQRWKLAITVVMFGISIELLQGLTPHRQPDVLDALANSCGVLLGWFTARILPNLPDRLVALLAMRR
jgi:VanZ family protein